MKGYSQSHSVVWETANKVQSLGLEMVGLFPTLGLKGQEDRYTETPRTQLMCGWGHLTEARDHQPLVVQQGGHQGSHCLSPVPSLPLAFLQGFMWLPEGCPDLIRPPDLAWPTPACQCRCSLTNPLEFVSFSSLDSPTVPTGLHTCSFPCLAGCHTLCPITCPPCGPSVTTTSPRHLPVPATPSAS